LSRLFLKKYIRHNDCVFGELYVIIEKKSTGKTEQLNADSLVAKIERTVPLRLALDRRPFI
jgi:hypothetical protein